MQNAAQPLKPHHTGRRRRNNNQAKFSTDDGPELEKTAHI